MGYTLSCPMRSADHDATQWAMYLNFTAEATADILIAVSLSVTLMTRKTGIIPYVLWFEPSDTTEFCLVVVS